MRLAGYEPKLLAGISVLMLAFLPALVVAAYALSVVRDAQVDLNSVYTTKALLARTLQMESMQQHFLVPVFVLSGDQAILNQLDVANRDFDQTLAELKRARRLTPEERVVLTAIGQAEQSLRDMAQPGIRMKQHGMPTDTIHAYFHHTAKVPSEAVSQDIQVFVQDSTDAYMRERQRNDKTFHHIIQGLAVASVMSVLLSVAVVIALLRVIRAKRSADQLERRLADRERQISTARKEAVETVAHDLRNPLGAILLLTECLENPAVFDTAGKPQRLIKSIRYSADSMHRLILNVLDNTKIDSGSLHVTKTACDIGAVIANTVSRFEILTIGQNIAIENAVPAGLPMVAVDEGRIEQVLGNLIGNAAKFTPRGGRISLTCDLREDAIEIAVADTGSGMSREQTDRVFQRYWQADDARARGTGLGLAISQAIVQAHGGDIRVDSEPGLGSTFRVVLPL